MIRATKGEIHMRRLTALLGVLSTALLVAVGTAGADPRPFTDLTSTVGGHHTWDSDQIDLEGVTQTGRNVYVAVLDTGLVPNYRDYFPEARVATQLGTGFEQPVRFSPAEDPCDLTVEAGALRQSTWVGSTGSTHGTHVTSTILGYSYYSNFDAVGGFPLPPIVVRGIAPDVTVIPVKVLADYQLPARPKCTDPGPLPSQKAVFGTDAMVAAGIDYVTGLANAGVKPIVINMSLGDTVPAQVIEDAIDDAIAAGVIVVASAGNAGEEGMGWPGAYPQVISAGSSGWTGEWLPASPTSRYRMWWLKDQGGALTPPLLPGSGNVADPASDVDTYVSDFSSREFASLDQELDVLAPGSWVRGPFPGSPGFAHLPWWSGGIGDLVSVGNPGNFFYVGGTSMSAPHVTSTAAMILQKNPSLGQAQVEAILKGAALPLPSTGSRTVFDITAASQASPAGAFVNTTWDTDCDGTPCDAVGSGLLQVDAAIAATPYGKRESGGGRTSGPSPLDESLPT